jgi:predicted GTPase
MNKIDEKAEELQKTIDEIGMSVYTGYTLADAIREGSKVSEQEVGGWGNGARACALTAAVISASARGYV